MSESMVSSTVYYGLSSFYVCMVVCLCLSICHDAFLTVEFLVLQLRACWYVIEAVARANIHIHSGLVLINYFKDFTMWDFDNKLYERLNYLNQNCWPVRRIATHVCCAPPIFVKTFNSILNGMISKEIRVRKLVHDVPESQLLDVLSEYGIYKEMLPAEMGGSILLDQAEWIASQRAEELKEI